MRFYVADGTYFATKDEAERSAREKAVDSYHDVQVELVEVETTKANVLAMLNVEGGHTKALGVVYTAKGKKKG